jgi:hypothetical protein
MVRRASAVSNHEPNSSYARAVSFETLGFCQAPQDVGQS